LLFDLQNDAREQVNLLADDEQALAVEAQAALADLRAAMQTTLWWEPKASQ
jgi:hypothetical protein